MMAADVCRRKGESDHGAGARGVIGTVQAYFNDNSQDGDFGTKIVDADNLLGERVLGFVFSPNAEHPNDIAEILLKTTGPFELKGDNQTHDKSLVVRVEPGPGTSGPARHCAIIFNPEKVGEEKGTLTVTAKHVDITGTFEKDVEFPLKGIGRK